MRRGSWSRCDVDESRTHWLLRERLLDPSKHPETGSEHGTRARSLGRRRGGLRIEPLRRTPREADGDIIRTHRARRGEHRRLTSVLGYQGVENWLRRASTYFASAPLIRRRSVVFSMRANVHFARVWTALQCATQ